MGLFDNVKLGAKDIIKKQRERAKDQREYNTKLKKQVKEARRKAYLKAAQTEAGKRARADAQRRFNPTPQQRSGGGMNIPASLLDPVGYATSPKQQVVQKIVRQRAAPKKRKIKKKKRSTKQRVITKIVQQKPQRSELDKLLYDM